MFDCRCHCLYHFIVIQHAARNDDESLVYTVTSLVDAGEYKPTLKMEYGKCIKIDPAMECLEYDRELMDIMTEFSKGI